MLFAEKDAPALKAWIVKRLEAPSRTDSDVDADVLADYVLALLRHDGGVEDVRKLCETELIDFLRDETKPFVEAVFQALSYKSYRPGAKEPLPTHAEATPPQARQPAPSPWAQPQILQNSSRKRSYLDSSLPGASQNGSTGPDSQRAVPGSDRDGRAIKQPRRAGAFGSDPSTATSGGLPPYEYTAAGSPLVAPGFPGIAAPASSMLGYQSLYNSSGQGRPTAEDILQFQQSAGQLLPMAVTYASPRPKSVRKRRQCRHFEKRGFCTRPDCPYEHSPVGESGAPQAAALNPAAMLAFQQGGFLPMWPPMPAPYMLGQQQAQQQRSRRGGKSKISADGPVYDQNNTSIVVEGIPDDHLSDTQVLSFFAQFGTVVSVDLQPRKKLATVKYETWAEANAAYMSPKVIFDNRFVKVFWYKEGGPDKGKTGSAPSNGDGDDEAGSPSAAPEFDMEEFLRKQEEAQKIFEEKMRKKQELDKRRQELEELQRDLLARQREERQKLVSKIALVATRAKRAQSGEDTGGTDASSISTSATGGITAPTQTEIIRAQLAALEEEAKQLGLDPDAILGGQLTSFSGSDKPPTASSFWSGRARGGTYSRGRGAFASRGRGRGGGAASSIAAAYAAYSLDNRPRRVAVTGVNFQMPENGEALRQHLLGIGEFTALNTTEEAGTITFADRRTAEAFYYSLTRATAAEIAEAAKARGQTPTPTTFRRLPGIAEPVELSWVAGDVPKTAAGNAGAISSAGARAAAAPNGSADAQPLDGGDVLVISDDEGVSEDDIDEHGHAMRASHMQRQNMDFDVAADDWEMQ